MIERRDISNFFDLEADAAKIRWEALMDLSIEERIRRRKAIGSVYLDKEFNDYSDENKKLFKVTFERNLSDFREGEYLILHKESVMSGIRCTINRFEDDNTIILEVYPPNLPIDMEPYYNTPLCLDKDLVDLRQSVYNNFLWDLPYEKKFWDNCILNTKSSPVFKDKREYEEELGDTETNFNLSLLPRQKEAIINSLSAENYYLIQGPPGTGKSFVLSFVILEEMAYLKHKVIVVGPNHMAINNTLIQVAKNYPSYSQLLCKVGDTYVPLMCKVGQTYNAPDFKIVLNEEVLEIINILHLDSDAANKAEFPWIIGLTPYSLYTSRAKSLKCDTLIVDEAGQMTIPLALMGMIKAKKIIFAGDYKQLPPIVSSEEICDEMKQSVFQSLVSEKNCTMLDTSFRMCEPICNFVSDLFYDGKVKPMKCGCGDLIINDDPLYSFDAPIIIHNIDDDGEQTSDKEAEFVSEVIEGYLKQGLSASEIAVLSPFRAHTVNVRKWIRKKKEISEGNRNLLVVETVDKMQGQEREVIIFSLAAGNIDYMVEMAEFLYNPNKLNVAFSRAKSKLIVVGNIDNLRHIDVKKFPHIRKMLKSQYVKFI